MELDLNPHQIRVLGCLIEKQLNTPEYYPLTLSALTNACNQKSSRDPVMQLSESEVLDAVHGLEKLQLAREKQNPGSRALKYSHKLTDTLTDRFGFSEQDIAILSLMFLRGPQSVGEIRTRTQRSNQFQDSAEIEQCLDKLSNSEPHAYVKSLPRQSGKRDIRYTHLFCDGNDDISTANVDVPEKFTSSDDSYVRTHEFESLKEEVAMLRAELATLKSQVTELL